MKRFLPALFIILACSFSVNTAAQELPLAVICLADAGKPLEREFCGLVLGAIDVHPATRLADETDRAAVYVAVIPYEVPACPDALALSVTVTYGSTDQGAPKFYIYSLCDVVVRDDLIKRAVAVVHQANIVTREWITKHFPGHDEASAPLRLEASPP